MYSESDKSQMISLSLIGFLRVGPPSQNLAILFRAVEFILEQNNSKLQHISKIIVMYNLNIIEQRHGNNTFKLQAARASARDLSNLPAKILPHHGGKLPVSYR